MTSLSVINPLEESTLIKDAIAERKLRDASEPLLQPNPNRFVAFPIQYPDLWKLYNNQVAVQWIHEEVQPTHDLTDWAKLTADERHFISRVLGFFAASDGIVMENLALRFMTEIQVPEAKMFYSLQNAMEAIHSITYSKLIVTYIEDREEQLKVLHSVEHVPCIQKKADWALSWMESADADFATRLMAFAVVEGVFFSGAFCSIYWIKQKGLMPALTFSNELISRDEGLHTEFACVLYSKCRNRLSENKAVQLMKEAVAIEKEFILDAIPCALIGMSAPRMSSYIEFVADRLMLCLGYAKIWNTANPFPWMEQLGLNIKTNFFEKKAGEYQRAIMSEPGQKEFSLTEEF